MHDFPGDLFVTPIETLRSCTSEPLDVTQRAMKLPYISHPPALRAMTGILFPKSPSP